MSLVAGTTIPMTAGLVVGVGAFLAWAAFAVPRQRAGRAAPASVPVVAPTPVTVRVVVRPHYTVAAPDDAAVRAAVARRYAARSGLRRRAA